MENECKLVKNGKKGFASFKPGTLHFPKGKIVMIDQKKVQKNNCIGKNTF